jgi:molybdate transport system substrate-binding protein
VRTRSVTRRGLLAAMLATPVTRRSGAEALAPLRVLCTSATETVLRALAQSFGAATGRSVILTTASAGSAGHRLRKEEKIDLVVNATRQLAAMAAAGLVDGTTISELGRMRLGLGLRQDGPLPDITTPEALRATLLAASSIAYADPAATPTGVHLMRMMDAMGIGTAMAPRSQLFQYGLDAVRAVAEGRAMLAMAQVSEILAVPGITLVGPLPEAVNLITSYAAAIAARTPDRTGALALLRYLTSAEGQARFRDAGFLIGA